MNQQSERTTSQFKPRFPKLKFLEKKAKDDLKFYVDDEYMLHVVPCMHSVGESKIR